jgi:hypothetical protein
VTSRPPGQETRQVKDQLDKHVEDGTTIGDHAEPPGQKVIFGETSSIKGSASCYGPPVVSARLPGSLVMAPTTGSALAEKPSMPHFPVLSGCRQTVVANGNRMHFRAR